jgi:hypothetical protein
MPFFVKMRFMSQARATPAVGTVHGADITSAPPLQAEENGRVETPAVSGSVDVAVKSSCNCAEAKRILLDLATSLACQGYSGCASHESFLLGLKTSLDCRASNRSAPDWRYVCL